MLPWIGLGILAALVISASHVLSVVALKRLSLPAFLVVRALAALAFTLPWLGHFDASQLDTRDWLLLSASLLLSPFLISIFYFRGLSSGQIATQNALRQVSPTFIILWQCVALGVFAPPLGWAGVACTLTGGALVASDRQTRIAPAALVFGLAAAATHAAAMLVQIQLLPRLDARTLIAAQNIVFAVLTGAWWLARRPPPRPATDITHSIPWLALAFSVLAGLLIQVVFDRLKLAILPELGAFKTACLILLQLPFTALLARLCFHERLNARQGIALGLIFTGALLGSA